ncbi:MAG: dihydrolipoamide acetyltransferase family protein [Nitrospiraceae bacterium]|nr:dihydrolipoamide acetyltransferase family protein [Nitrospiraceae bacterium]
MPYEFRLPDLGEGIAEAEIRKWLVKEGDTISEHQNVLEVETDKAVVEMPSPKDGKVGRLFKDEGETARVGDVLMTIAADGEAETAGKRPETEPPMVETGAEESFSFLMADEMPMEIPAPGARPEGRPKEKEKESVTVMGELPESEEEEKPLAAAPAARQIAKEMGISEAALRNLRGSGPGGLLTKEDVLKFSTRKIYNQTGDEFGPVERVALKGIRKAIARKLNAARLNAVSVTVTEEADITDLWEIRQREKSVLRERGIHLTFLPFFIKAAQHALKEHPVLNASLQGEEGREEIIIKKYIHMGIAVDTPEGLMVPVIRDVDKKTIIELSAELEELSAMARERKITLERLRGNSFTITNYGHSGGLFATPIINSPDVAILGTGRIAERPWAISGKIEPRKILPLSLTFDHRVADGAEASKFLTKIVRFLEDPALIFVEST